MKKISLFLSVLLLNIGSAYAACSYDLNGVVPNDSTFQKYPLINNQKVSYKILNSNTEIKYAAIPSAFGINSTNQLTGLFPLPNTGVFGLEFNTTTIPTTLTASKILQGYQLMMMDSNNKMHSLIITYVNNGALSDQNNNKNVVFILATSPKAGATSTEADAIYGHAQPISSSSIQNLGIYINQNTNQLGIIINKQNLGYVGSFSSKLKSLTYSPVVQFQGFSSNSPYINKDYIQEIITDKSKFTNTFPTGTKDICEN
ncbi:DUF4882 family protein [Acinetobacter sp. CFCC 10889]|uniref:DUF4882 family protein n=1 Tax=Acinetobacter sp. CFCC 10889 TaxID=1775557 RepID=UPI000DCF8C5E|nr:DUF4882 family protein [Acinetobacter sp. CFCC 10889]